MERKKNNLYFSLIFFYTDFFYHRYIVFKKISGLPWWLSTKKDVQLKSCELSFIWGKMRNAAQEAASQRALRDCAKAAVGKGQCARFCPSSEESFCWKATQCAITGLGLNSQRSLDICLLIMIQESNPSSFILPCLELLYYNHWYHTDLCIWSTASYYLVIIIFIGGSVIPLVL